MKSYLYLPFILLLGLVIGGWGARSDLREVKNELRDAKEQLKDGKGSRRNVQITGGVAQLLNIDRAEAVSKKKSSVKKPAEKEASASVDNVDSEKKADDVVKEKKPRRKMSPEERKEQMQEGIEKAAELWEVRSRIARSTFIDRCELDEEEAGKFDVLVDAMNLRLSTKIEEWADEVEKKEDVGPEDGLRLVNDVTDVMVTAYDEMDRGLSEGWREKNDNELNVTDFIDPSVAMPLVRVEDKMNKIGPGGPSGDRNMEF